MSNFLKIYKDIYKPHLFPVADYKKNKVLPNLYQRGEGFQLIFELLLKQNLSSYQIVETGVTRSKSWVDGQSTLLFQEFCRIHSGSVRSVDINEETCIAARTAFDKSVVSIQCKDSVKFLKLLNCDKINLFYLDSYDVTFKNFHLSAEHHLKEFKTIELKIQPGTIVAIDDNTFYEGVRSGKGAYIYEYLKNKNIYPIVDDYQIIYQF
jgi:hypothetical protein